MKKVLVIEDNRDILENTAEILELANYKVFTAQNGMEGIETAIKVNPDLIVCDIMMPGLDGYGVLHMVQNNPAIQDVPFIFLTAKNEQSDIRKGMALGADDYIPKPYDPTDLLKAIEGRLKKSELVRQHAAADYDLRHPTPRQIADDKLLKDFVEGRHTDRYKRKQRIFTEGNHPVKLYFVVNGKVKIYKTNDEGKELILKIVNEGEFFGYNSMIENTVYKDNADALEDSEIAIIPRNEFEELMISSPEVCKRFIKLLANDVAEKEEQLLRIAYNSLRRKVADALLILQKKYNSQAGKINIHLSRENLAALAGTATESLIRTLTHFKEENLIEIHDGNITILQKEKLEKMVN